MFNIKSAFKLFTLTVFLVFLAIPSLAKELEINNISRIVIDPVRNHTCTLNLYFENDYKGKAFIQKADAGLYHVYLPETEFTKKKVKVTYKNRFDKQNLNLNIEEKPYTNKEHESSYVRIAVNMNSDYSLRLMSGNIKDANLNIFNDSSINLYSLILLGFGLIIFLMFRKLSKAIKDNRVTNCYTLFPANFNVPKPELSEKLNFKRNLKSNLDKTVEQGSAEESVKVMDSSSFACFDVPKTEAEKQPLTEEIDSNIKKTSKIFKTKPNLSKIKQTNPIIYKEEEPKIEEVREEKSNDLLSVLNITENKGFYVTAANGEIKLCGFTGQNIFPLATFKDLEQLNLQARFYDKHGENDVYIVRLDNYKSMVEISEDSMKELAVL